MKSAALIAGYILFAGMFVLGVYSAATGNRFLAGYDGLGVALFFGAILVCATWMRSHTASSVVLSSGQANEVLVLTVPARKRLILAAIFVTLAVGSYLLMESAPARRVLHFQVFFVLMASVALMTVIAASRRVSLTLSSKGLEHTPLGVGVIDWRDIRGFHVKRGDRLDCIKLDIIEPAKYAGGTLMRRLTGSHFEIMTTMFDCEPEWLADEIRKRIAAFGKPTTAEHKHIPGTVTEAP